MSDAILVLNAGSSSLKFSVFLDDGALRPLLRGQLEGLATHPRFLARDINERTVGEQEWPAGSKIGHDRAIEFLFKWGRSGVLGGHTIVAVGHRVAHGGKRFPHPVPIDATVLVELEELVSLVPLHQPHNLAAIRAVSEKMPDLAQVACFDTSFHCTVPPIARAFALPRRYTEEGICRYGFHGLSYEYISSILPTLDVRAASGRTVVAHLGNGASMCALKNSQSIATTMGFSSIDGLPMGTRCGALDPGVLIYLMDRYGLNARDLEKLLYKESGLYGVSGISSDVRTLLASSEPHAAEALDLFVYRIGRELGSLVAALGGLDAVVFTGGIGENSAAIRTRVCQDAAWLGITLDERANGSGGPRISRAESPASAWVLATNEELMIAKHTQRLFRAAGPTHASSRSQRNRPPLHSPSHIG